MGTAVIADIAASCRRRHIPADDDDDDATIVIDSGEGKANTKIKKILIFKF